MSEEGFPEGTIDEVRKYVRKKGWEIKPYVTHDRTEIKVEICPFCGNPKYNFELNAITGLYRCWACHARGSFVTLQRELGDAKDGIVRIVSEQGKGHKVKPNKTYPSERMDAPYKALMANDMGGLEYLRGRGFNDTTIQHFKLGVCRSADGFPRLIIPHFKDGHVALIMYRTIPPVPKSYLRESGMESVLFNEEGAHTSKRSIIVCEGQFDAMSVWQAGYHNVVSVSTGAGSEWSDSWVDLIGGFEKVIMVYDGDEAGRSGALTIRQRIGEDKVWIADPGDGNDVNTVLVNEGIPGVKRIIETARPAPVGGVVSVTDVIADLQDALINGDPADQGYDWFCDHITSAVGNVCPGDLIELVGAPGTGKTTLMLQQCLHLTVDLKVPTLVICFEMTDRKLVRKVIQSFYRISKDQISLEVLGNAMIEFDGVPLYFSCPTKDSDIAFVIDQATKAFKRYGVRSLVVDNLIILSEAAKDPIREQAIVTRELKTWARIYGNSVYLIAHPRKIERGMVEGIGDVRGSGAVTANADIVLSMWRKDLAPRDEEAMKEFNQNNGKDLLDPKTAIYPSKARDSAARVGWLYFHGDKSYFRDATSEDWPARETSQTGKGLGNYGESDRGLD